MKIPATKIDSIVDAVTTIDGQHIALRLRDVDAQEFILGIPITQVERLIELGARALTDRAREGHDTESKLLGSTAAFPVVSLHLGPAADCGAILGLTLQSGGILAFRLSPPMVAALQETAFVQSQAAPTRAPHPAIFA